MPNSDSLKIISVTPTKSEDHQLLEHQYDGWQITLSINDTLINTSFAAPRVFDWEEEEEVCGLDSQSLLSSCVERLRRLAAI